MRLSKTLKITALTAALTLAFSALAYADESGDEPESDDATGEHSTPDHPTAADHPSAPEHEGGQAGEHGPPTTLHEIPVLTLPEHASDVARQHVADAHARRDARRADSLLKRQEKIAAARGHRPEAGSHSNAQEHGSKAQERRAVVAEKRAAAQERRQAASERRDAALENATTNKQRAAERRAAGQGHRPAQ